MIAIEESTLQALLVESAKKGAEQAFRKYVRYKYKEAAKLLGITDRTLSNRIAEGKIKAVDGLITGAEIDRYLSS
jgi:uncharacterized membrane-anchored protein